MKFNVDDLIEKGLVRKKTYTEGPYKGLSVLKYTNRVFYDNLWSESPRLLECRGMVVDQQDNVVVRPFKKVFNLGENGTKLPATGRLTYARKINGFMLAVTNTDEYGTLYSTTGTLDSEYAQLGRKVLKEFGYKNVFAKGFTYLFEICHELDPHIIKEQSGAYLIGLRNINSGALMTEHMLDRIAREQSFLRPCSFDANIEDITPDFWCSREWEGAMIVDQFEGVHIGKYKHPNYVTARAMARLSDKKVARVWGNVSEMKKRVPEEMYSLVERLVLEYSEYEWMNLDEQQRITTVRRWIEVVT